MGNIRYNWHGDVVARVATDGSGGGWARYGAWGEMYSVNIDYAWNGAWGYLAFPASYNFDLNDVLDVGLYYVHGRWYNHDTGMFLSPDEKGEYLYGSGQDAVNWAWMFFRGAICEFSDAESINALSAGEALSEFINKNPGWFYEHCTQNQEEPGYETGRWLGWSASSGLSVIEFNISGGTAVLAALGIGPSGGASAPVVGLGLVGVTHSTGVMVRNITHPPITFAKGSSASNLPNKPSDIAGNTNVRPSQPEVSKSLVAKYANEMKNGTFNWHAMEDKIRIVIADNGTFLEEGHHRFLAARLAGVEVPSNAIEFVRYPGNWPYGFDWTRVVWSP